MSSVNEPPQLSIVVTFKAVWFSLGEDKMKWGSVSQQREFAARWLKVAVKALSGSKRLRRCYFLIFLKARAIWCGLYRLLVQSQHFSAADHKWKSSYSNMFWWEWLSLDDKLKDLAWHITECIWNSSCWGAADRVDFTCLEPNICRYIKYYNSSDTVYQVYTCITPKTAEEI